MSKTTNNNEVPFISANQETNTSTEITPPKRRVRRRVVRQAGAADVPVEVTIEKSQRDSDNTSVSVEQVSQKKRSTQRSSHQRDTQKTTRKKSSQPRQSKKASKASAVSQQLFVDPSGNHQEKPQKAEKISVRPMASLLFQEPVIPAVDEEPVAAEKIKENSQPKTAKKTKNRRLNAQERQAAAEVERIEKDFANNVLDTLDERYSDSSSSHQSRRQKNAKNAIQNNAPSRNEDSEENNRTDSHESTTRRRRRRHSKEATKNDSVSSKGSEKEVSQKSSSKNSSEIVSEDSGENGNDSQSSVTIIRRRRRRKSSDQENEETTDSRNSRKQHYINEITDIEGSTRLEAKRQRRRDNRRDRARQSTITEQDFLARRESVKRQMVVREKDNHTQISVIEDDILVEHYVSDIQEVSTVGNIYLGRIQNVLPSMEAAFVDIGQARNGVLYAGEVNWDLARLEGNPRRIELAYKSGDPVLVQVTKDPIGHKGARLTSQVTLAGRFIVLVPSGAMTGVSRKLPERERNRLKKIVSSVAPADMGVIIRTAAEGASEEALAQDCKNLVQQWESITKQVKTAKNKKFKKPKLLKSEPDVVIRVIRDIFNSDFETLSAQGESVYQRITDYLTTTAPDLLDKLSQWDPAEHNGEDIFDQWNIDSQLRKGMERKVYLPSGGSLVIDRTEAMTTVDVNTGRFIGKGKSLEETVTRCNLEAAEEITRQLRLRDIGGMIMIDFVDMVLSANRDLVLRRLVECLARDRTKHQVAEVTSLGLVQMTRKRIGQGLVEAFSQECPTCHGRGFILHDEPTISSKSADPYAAKGGDPFVKSSQSSKKRRKKTDKAEDTNTKESRGSSHEVKAKLASIAAAASSQANDESIKNEE